MGSGLRRNDGVKKLKAKTFMHKPFIALDWGTTSFRAYLVGANGAVQNQFADSEGILAVKDGGFEAVLESHIGTWDKSLPVIAAG
jgi:2-dehydro-3-deoxygalactonokinase